MSQEAVPTGLVHTHKRTLTLNDGRELPIIFLEDENGDEVDVIYEAKLLIAGTKEHGYYEIKLDGWSEFYTTH